MVSVRIAEIQIFSPVVCTCMVLALMHREVHVIQFFSTMHGCREHGDIRLPIAEFLNM